MHAPNNLFYFLVSTVSLIQPVPTITLLGKTPLLLACQNANLARENYPIIQFLLGKGCDPFSVDKNQNSCIQLLCKAPPYKTNHILAVKKLLEVMEISPEKTKENLNSPSNKCDHVLGIMASNWKETNEEIEILELFVKAGADPHKRCAIESKTLHNTYGAKFIFLTVVYIGIFESSKR